MLFGSTGYDYEYHAVVALGVGDLDVPFLIKFIIQRRL